MAIEDAQQVVIGESKLSKEDFEKVCNFINKNKELLLKHFNPESEFEDSDLFDKLKK